MTTRQVLLRVEVPNALPLILGGLRSATLQVIATATVAAYVNLGGLGRYIFDGLALRSYDRVLVGALLVAALALIVDGLLAAAVWASVPAPDACAARRRSRRRQELQNRRVDLVGPLQLQEVAGPGDDVRLASGGSPDPTRAARRGSRHPSRSPWR